MTTPTQPAAPTGTRRLAADRFVGVDIARLLAIIGMMAAHIWVFDAWSGRTDFARTAAGIAHAASDGFPSTLFAVLGGVSLTLASARVRTTHGPTGVVVAAIARGVAVLVIGAVVALVPNIIIPVLVPFGAAMIVAAAFLLAPTWLLVTAISVLAVAGGWINAVIRERVDVWADPASPSLLELTDPTVMNPVTMLRAIAFTGVYPVITWLAYLLVGMLVARVLVRARERGTLAQVCTILAAVGIAAAGVAITVGEIARALLGTVIATDLDPESARLLIDTDVYGAAGTGAWWAQLVPSPHSGTTADILRTAGVAIVCIAVLVLCFDARTRVAGARRSWLVRWLRATGAAPLSIYVLHYLLTVVTSALPLGGVDAPAFTWWAVQVAIVLGVGAVLAWLGRRGPLETLVGWIVKLALRAVPRRPASPTTPPGTSVGSWSNIATSETVD